MPALISLNFGRVEHPMSKLKKQLSKLLRNESGATAVEYAVMLALIILAAVASIANFGTATADSFNDSNAQIEAVL